MIKFSLRLGMPAFVLLVGLNCAAVAQDKLRIAGGLAGTWENSFSELGQNAGLFKKRGLVLEIFYTQGAGEIQQAVISGSADSSDRGNAHGRERPHLVRESRLTGDKPMTEVIRKDRTSSLRCRPVRSALQTRAGRPLPNSCPCASYSGWLGAILRRRNEVSRATAAGFLRMPLLASGVAA
jgi:NitT/TauT family transport system substrate-binding protein